MTQQVRDLFWLILLPLSWIYALAAALSLGLRGKKKSEISILSVGNIHIGGTGKTPVVIQIANHFKFKKIAILSRGYKSKSTQTGLKLEKKSSQGPRFFGDEPWLMAQSTESDVFVGANRIGLMEKFDIASSHQQVLLDDGFQHVQLQRNVNLLILPADENPWETACLPLGTLREGLLAIKRATLVVLTCSNEDSKWIKDWINLVSQVAPHSPCFLAIRKMCSVRDSQGTPLNSHQLRLGAFCGIARPQRFFEDLKKWGSIQLSKAYPDHHGYSLGDVLDLVEKAKSQSLDALLTTSKDFHKVSGFFSELGFPLYIAQIEYEFPDPFWKHLEEKCGHAC